MRMDTDPKVPGTGDCKRRYQCRVLKRQIVEETLRREASVSMIARRQDVNADRVFKWRRGCPCRRVACELPGS